MVMGRSLLCDLIGFIVAVGASGCFTKYECGMCHVQNVTGNLREIGRAKVTD